jgi:glycosyltransferase involved in cell wall biosynthesis
LEKRICFIINKPVVGGAELFLLKLIDYMALHFECHIIFLNSQGQLKERFLNSGATVHFLELKFNPFSILKEITKLTQLLKQIRPDVVHSWLFISDLMGGLAAKIARVPLIYWSIRQSNVSFSQNNLHSYLLIRICGVLSRYIPDQIISCSAVASTNNVNDGMYVRNKIIEIPNGFDIELYKERPDHRALIRNELDVLPSVKLIGIIGRFDIQKGFDNFVNIAFMVKDKVPNVRFVFIGSGCTADNSKLQKLVNDKNLFDYSYFLGTRADLVSIYNALDLVIIASRGEAFPNVLGEAMSVGTPVVTTNVGEIPVILNGIQESYSPGSNVEMADKAVEVLQLDELAKNQLSHKLRERIVENYNLRNIMDSYRRVYAVSKQ